MRTGLLTTLAALLCGTQAFCQDGLVQGYQLDVSRCKVPTMPTLFRMVDLLASLGYNQFQLYTEHTFA